MAGESISSRQAIGGTEMRIQAPVDTTLNRPEDTASIFRSILLAECPEDRDKEHLWVAGLTSQNTIKYIELVSLGILNASLVHPREVFRLAITEAVASIILCHNHPSGDPYPSEQDRQMTRQLKEGGRILGIEVLDHLIITTSARYISLEEDGFI